VDVSEMQRKLSQWATDDPTKRFVDLYSLLCNEVWLRVAANDTLRNKGSETAGVDDMTQSNFLGANPAMTSVTSVCTLADLTDR
jgi:retron-type reverse transcriptase